mmetsp:Transcript_19317/g.29424  ORF Transcript_19317/g.29424 Transcript_19317/m.29424 type:complete len:101 (+) Transcript_19317:40-342(+)
MSSLTLPPPLSLGDCFDVGTNSINVLRYYKYSRKRRQMNGSLSVLHSIMTKKKCTNKSHELLSNKKRVHHRSVKRYKRSRTVPSVSCDSIIDNDAFIIKS